MREVIRATSISLARVAMRAASVLRGARRLSLSVLMTGAVSMQHILNLPTPFRVLGKQSGESGVRTPRSSFTSGPPDQLAEPGGGFRLFSARLVRRDHRHIGAVIAFGDELHRARGGGEKGMVASHAYVRAGPELGAALT